MPSADLYASVAITKKASMLVKHECKKNGRKMYVEFESLVVEALAARRAAEKEKRK